MLVARIIALIVGAGVLPIEMVTLQGGAKDCKSRVTLPRTYQPQIDAALTAWAKRQVCGSGEASASPIELTTSPTIVRNDARLFAVSFEETIDSERVHDTHERVTFNFLEPDGWRIYLPEIFDSAGLKKISELAAAALRKLDRGLDADMIARGTDPRWSNFAVFVLNDKTLALYFASERVGSYADGPQQIELPLDKLAPYLRKDWRLPAASFDCAKAETVVERAICGDVALARLDRELHEDYQMTLEAAESAKKETLRQAQHAWLQRRDTVCAELRRVTCLADFYKERLGAIGAR